MSAAAIHRVWAMPSADTFDVVPIRAFVERYLAFSQCSVDPFARNKRWATYTNDLNPNTEATEHLDAEIFMAGLTSRGVLADLIILDPPYSPRQIKECYESFGRTVTQKDTQSASLYRRVHDACIPLLARNGIVLSFGWNSSGMGKQRGFILEEVLLVCHGGAHNDTICIAERLAA